MENSLKNMEVLSAKETPMSLLNAHNTIKEITADLFTAEERRLSKVREHLIAANREQYPNRPHDGFTYKGKPYDPPNLISGKRVRVPLHPSLYDRMDNFLADESQIWTDRHQISQMLFSVLKSCESLQDIRDALPECLVGSLRYLRGLVRQRPPAYTLNTNPRILRQFEKLLPRIEFYSTARLLY